MSSSDFNFRRISVKNLGELLDLLFFGNYPPDIKAGTPKEPIPANRCLKSFWKYLAEKQHELGRTSYPNFTRRINKLIEEKAPFLAEAELGPHLEGFYLSVNRPDFAQLVTKHFLRSFIRPYPKAYLTTIGDRLLKVAINPLKASSDAFEAWEIKTRHLNDVHLYRGSLAIFRNDHLQSLSLRYSDPKMIDFGISLAATCLTYGDYADGREISLRLLGETKPADLPDSHLPMFFRLKRVAADAAAFVSIQDGWEIFKLPFAAAEDLLLKTESRMDPDVWQCLRRDLYCSAVRTATRTAMHDDPQDDKSLMASGERLREDFLPKLSLLQDLVDKTEKVKDSSLAPRHLHFDTLARGYALLPHDTGTAWDLHERGKGPCPDKERIAKAIEKNGWQGEDHLTFFRGKVTEALIAMQEGALERIDVDRSVSQKKAQDAIQALVDKVKEERMFHARHVISLVHMRMILLGYAPFERSTNKHG